MTIEEVSHYILIYDDTSNWNLKSPIKEQPANLPRAILFVEHLHSGNFCKMFIFRNSFKKMPKAINCAGLSNKGRDTDTCKLT